MRIVYDDTMQQKAVKLVAEYLAFLNNHMDRVVRYDWGMDRVQSSLVKARLQGYLEDFHFDIGKTVTHANGIGNNCQYPIYYDGEWDEIQHCANININSGLYGDVYVSIEDYNGKCVGRCYKLTRHGVTITK